MSEAERLPGEWLAREGDQLALDLQQQEGVQHEEDREEDRRAIQVALDHRAAADRAAAAPPMPKAPERPASLPECRSTRKISTTAMITWMTAKNVNTGAGSLALLDFFRLAGVGAVAVAVPSPFARSRRRGSPALRAAARRRPGRSPRRRACRSAWSSSASRISRYLASLRASASVRTRAPRRRPREGQSAISAPARAIRPPIHIQVTSGLTITLKVAARLREVASATRVAAQLLQPVRSGPAPGPAAPGWRAAARISAPSALHCGGVPGAALHACPEALVGRRAPALDAGDVRLLGDPEVVPEPGPQPTSLVASPAK